MNYSGMVYDPEKFRDKRERVLGVKKRKPILGIFVVLFVSAIFVTTGITVIPQVTDYLRYRHLDDAIIKPAAGLDWSTKHSESLHSHAGVVQISYEEHSDRLVVTYNRNMTNSEDIMRSIAERGFEANLLNVVGHAERMKIVREEQEFEAL